jgi:hypothetical protein
MPTFAEPYIPGLVPSLNSLESMQDLERYLNEEMDRIALAISQTTVQAAYGALLVASSSGDQALDTTDAILTAWDSTSPAVPNRAIPDASTDNITVLEAGVYFIAASFASVLSADTFLFTFYKNGVATPVTTVADPSNQTDAFGVNLMGEITLAAGDVLDIRASVVTGTGTIDIGSGTFNLFRISELQATR